MTCLCFKDSIFCLLDIFSVIVGLVVASSAPASIDYIPFQQWEPLQGDHFIVDTRSNIGYLIHDTGAFTSMKVGSGQRKKVHYMKRTYNAATPLDSWIVQEINVQSDRLTFGKDGTFMRLSRDGKKTPYGIHSVANIDDLLATEERYYSMGCVLVDYDTLDILLDTYKLNGNTLNLLTIDGLKEPMTPVVARNLD